MVSDDRLGEIQEKYKGYKIYDRDGEELGTVSDVSVKETDLEEYIGVKMGFFGLRSTLIPLEIVSVNERERAIEIAESRERIENAPTHDDDEDLTPDFESVIRRYFSLETTEYPTGRGSSGQQPGGIDEPDPDATSSEDDAPSSDDTQAERHTALSRKREPVGQQEYRDREDGQRARSTGRGDPGVGSAETSHEEAGYQETETEARARGGEPEARDAVGEDLVGREGGHEYREFEDMQDQQSTTTGFPLERRGGPGESVAGDPQVEQTDRRGGREDVGSSGGVDEAGRYADAPAGGSDSRKHGDLASMQDVDKERGGSTSYSSESEESYGGGETEETFERPLDKVTGMWGEESGRAKVRRRVRRTESNKSTREESEYRSDW
ncbi:MAG: hypothetical protein AVDCRST_MAG28-1558 [uncultured Rubrobacteraceae bacterium]|uniref:PRC-barrel domain-containing protein n=1 Tax=uncultured Rubrobacteraceae bacterium TaxID=349277 RepID=A0A6J4Q7C7_9ACTN|nr:MAG: hypothetical protein AVDCRST_MAG28-1558 [uncultured Rubrobacteraceae bacterium]